MGTPDFAVACLKRIHESDHNILAVITAPDRPAGRGRKLRGSAVKEYAQEHQLPILQPLKLKDTAFLSELKSYGADLFVVVAFRMLPMLVWAMPKLGTINLHGSLLPQYRGAAPINWAIINGDKETGVTTFYIDAEIDQGKIIAHRKVNIDFSDNAGTLHDKLMTTGAQLLLETVDDIAAGEANAVVQESSSPALKHAPKLNPENRTIQWDLDADTIHNLVRGLCPYPSALCELILADQTQISCKLFQTHLLEVNTLSPGFIETDNKTYIHVGTETFNLALDEIQLSGKKRLAVRDLLNGVDLDGKCRFNIGSSNS
jgi:methionyl-tRNA formyltransferase